MLRRKRAFVLVGAAALLLTTTAILFAATVIGEVGEKLDEYKGVVVYSNGPIYSQSHGKHYGADGYYYGQKWQCVEYVKRFFHQAYQHKMPDVWGHAKDFFDDTVPQGQLNTRRDLLQFRNGGNIYPKTGDLVVFTNGGFGHVAIISQVTTNDVEIIQQNVLGHPRQRLPLTWTRTSFTVGKTYQPAGWLRVQKRKSEK